VIRRLEMADELNSQGGLETWMLRQNLMLWLLLILSLCKVGHAEKVYVITG
jgi:hypothetical protein